VINPHINAHTRMSICKDGRRGYKAYRGKR